MIVARKKRDVEAQPLPGLIWSEARHADQAEGRTFSVLSDSRVSSRKLKLPDEPIAKIEAPR